VINQDKKKRKEEDESQLPGMGATSSPCLKTHASAS
jgi:hypothetical protein